MDFVLFALSLLGLLCAFVLAFALSQALRVVFAWAAHKWPEDWGRVPLLSRVSSRVLSVVLVCCFLALVL